MTISRRTRVLAALVAVGALAGWYYAGGHRTPDGQAPLAELAPDAWSSFKTEFNDSADRVRLVVLLSPT